jgi:hypothetical protein
MIYNVFHGPQCLGIVNEPSETQAKVAAGSHYGAIPDPERGPGHIMLRSVHIEPAETCQWTHYLKKRMGTDT